MELHWCLHIVFCWSVFSATAQPDSVQVTKNFQFEDGIYLSFEELQANQPALSWEEVDAQVVTSQQSFMAQADYIRKKDGEKVPPKAIWGICLQGTPYVRLSDTTINKRAMAFAGLRVRGRICYYSYETEESRMIEIAAYNPLTGRPFRKGAVSRVIPVVHEKMLHFEDGRQSTFNKELFLKWIEEDKQLWRTVAELSDEELEKKLYKCLLIYDDRNPVYVPARE